MRQINADALTEFVDYRGYRDVLEEQCNSDHGRFNPRDVRRRPDSKKRQR
jgi:hypothetical protein